MAYRLNDISLSVVVMALILPGYQAVAAEGDDVEEKAGENVEQEQAENGADGEPEFPSELLLAPDKMPEPVHKNVLRRIEDHERLEQLMLDRPLEIREKGAGD